MAKGVVLILLAFVLMGGAVVIGHQKFETRKVDLAHLPKDPTIPECNQIASLYEKEIEAMVRAMSSQAMVAPTAAGGQFVKAGGLGTGFKAVSRSETTGLGGEHARLSMLEKVERYLQRQCN